MKKEIRSDLTSKNKITDSINIVSKAVLAYEREPQKTEQQEDIKMKEVVVVSGATFSSKGLISAVKAALKNAEN